MSRVKVSTKEKLFLGLTAARLVQGVDYYRRVKSGKSIKAATAAIIAVDLLDGIIARKVGVDGPSRRAADSAVDGGIIALGLAATHQKHPKARRYAGALAAREAFVGLGWAVDLASSKQVKKGDDWHKLPSLAVAAFGLAAHHGSERTMKHTGRLAFAVNAALAYDYFKGWTKPEERTRKLDTGVVEVAGFYDARKAIWKLGQSLPQLGPGRDGEPPQLGAGEPAIELQEHKSEGDLPPGTYKEIS